MALTLQGVSQGYRSKQVFSGLNLEIKPGVQALLGPNGAGKTTLLKTMATLLPPKTGELWFNGSPLNSSTRVREARKHIGYLPQSFGYYPQFTVSEFVEYGAWLRGMSAKHRRSEVHTALARVDMESQATTKMRRLSGGMVQRVGIAWAIVGNPDLILLDEPTVGLDPEQRISFRRIIAELSDTSVVLSTHHVSDISTTASRVIVFSDGNCAFDGGVNELAQLAPATGSYESTLESGYLHAIRNSEAVVA